MNCFLFDKYSCHVISVFFSLLNAQMNLRVGHEKDWNESLWFSDVSRGYTNETLGLNGFNMSQNSQSLSSSKIL